MAVYHGTFSVAGVNGANTPLFNLKSGAADRIKLLEVGFFIETASANAPQYGLMRMSAVGTGTITTATLGLSDAADGTAAGSLETAWATTRPTVTGGAFRRAMVTNTIGNGIIFDFTNRPIIVPVSAGLCGVMINAAGATLGVHGGYVVWDE